MVPAALSHMQQKNITVKKTARYFTIGEASSSIRNVWFICHGYGQLANYFLRNFSALDDGRTLLVSAEGLHRFYLKGSSDRVGASWMTREERLSDIKDYVGFLDEVYADVMKELDRNKIKVHVLGFSQGAATVVRWLCMGKASADSLVMWAGAFPPDIDYKENAQRLGPLKKYVVMGDQDEFISQQQLEDHIGFLKQNNLAHTLVSFHGKHEIHRETLLKVAAMISE